MKELSSFGVWLKTKLAENGMKQKDLANAIGVTEASLSRYIHENRSPRGKTMVKIMGYFDAHMTFESNGDPVIIEQEQRSRSITLRQLLFYMTEGEIIQICDGHDGWDAFTEFSATSKLLEPFKDRRIICMGAEERKDGCAIRVEIED
jgi:transcriptional regulator with XRE-family HTH domain